MGAALGAGVGARARGLAERVGPEPLEELQDVVLRASHAEHEERDWRAVFFYRNRSLKTGAIDGTLIRVPNTPSYLAMYGSVGTEYDCRVLGAERV